MSGLPWLPPVDDPLDPRPVPTLPRGATQCTQFAFNIPQPVGPPPSRRCTRVYWYQPDYRELDRRGPGALELHDVTSRQNDRDEREGAVRVCWGEIRNGICQKCKATH
jgi:hypothetical protein